MHPTGMQVAVLRAPSSQLVEAEGPNSYPSSHSGTQKSWSCIVRDAEKLSQLPAPVPGPPFVGFT